MPLCFGALKQLVLRVNILSEIHLLLHLQSYILPRGLLILLCPELLQFFTVSKLLFGICFLLFLLGNDLGL